MNGQSAHRHTAPRTLKQTDPELAAILQPADAALWRAAVRAERAAALWRQSARCRRRNRDFEPTADGFLRRSRLVLRGRGLFRPRRSVLLRRGGLVNGFWRLGARIQRQRQNEQNGPKPLHVRHFSNRLLRKYRA